MIYRRKVYKIRPEKLEVFNDFFHNYLLPNQLKHGAKLIGRWVTESKDEITALWEYKSYEDYQRIESHVRQDEMHQKAREKRQTLGHLYLESQQDFLTSTGQYAPPRHIVAVGGYITNEQGEVLLVKTYWRADTWETPGGQVEAGETLDAAAHREIVEETGIRVQLHGITGVYSNQSNGVVNVMFGGEAIGGTLTTSEETQDVRFVKLNDSNIDTYVTRPYLKARVLDAMRGEYTPYQTQTMQPND